ncbi:MAG: hypothetical protein ACXABY_26635, partial [Candidatus Thorarchaeota archaeon]
PDRGKLLEQLPPLPPLTPELTDAEKEALLHGWNGRGNHTVNLGRGQWGDLETLLYSSDPYVASKREEHTSELRQLLSSWTKSKT